MIVVAVVVHVVYAILANVLDDRNGILDYLSLVSIPPYSLFIITL